MKRFKVFAKPSRGLSDADFASCVPTPLGESITESVAAVATVDRTPLSRR